MAILSQDTTRAAERLQIDLWRQMTPQKKAALAASLCRAAARYSWQGVRQRQPELEDEVAYRVWAQLWQRQPLPEEVKPMSLEIDPYAITKPVLQALQDAGAQVLIVGSLASIIHGEIRLTQDGDLLCDLQLDQVDRFVAAIQADYYVDDDAVRTAVQNRQSFNVIHLDTAFKVDVFVPGLGPFLQTQLQRAQHFEGIGPVATVEDTILAKLNWYRLGGEASDSQWRDILALFLANPDLDEAYLREWAAFLTVTDLLQRALAQATS